MRDKENCDALEWDDPTGRWIKAHPGVETTVVRCSACGLHYKPQLGHSCKKSKPQKRRSQHEQNRNAAATIKDALLQDPVIREGMPFYLVAGSALETSLEALKKDKEEHEHEN